MADQDDRRPKPPGHLTPRSVPTPRSLPAVSPPTDQDRPAPKPLVKQLAHTTKRRTEPRGNPIVEPEVRLTFDDDRDRRRSDSAGAPLPSSRRAQSQHESWEDMHTPPQTDAECWRAIKQLGIDVQKLDDAITKQFNELSDDIAEQRMAFTSLLTNTLNQLLEQKNLVMTAEVKVKETNALTTIHDRSEMEAVKRKIMWKWIGGTLAAAFTLLVGALIHKYL